MIDSGIKSVVAIEAHPDDVELGCLGTLLRLKAAGTKITIICITNGDKGSGNKPSLPFEQVTATRMAEASAVAAGLGGEFVCLGAEDEYLYDTKELRDALTAALRRAKADLVLAPPPTDYQSDHTIASEMSFQCTHLAANPPLSIAEPPLKKIPSLYYYDCLLGLEFQPSFYIDISDVIDEKKRLAALHTSQMVSMKYTSNFDLVDYVEIVNRFRGLQSGVAYAEGFMPCLRYPRLRALNTFPW